MPFDRSYTSSYCFWFFSNIIILLEINGFKKVWNCQITTTVDVFCFHLKVSFRFYCAMLCKRGLCCHVVSVCLSVCLFVCLSVRPSVTFVDHIKTNKHIVTFFSLYGSPIILVFQFQTGCRYTDGNPPNGDVVCKGGMIKWRFFHKYLAVSQKR